MSAGGRVRSVVRSFVVEWYGSGLQWRYLNLWFGMKLIFLRGNVASSGFCCVVKNSLESINKFLYNENQNDFFYLRDFPDTHRSKNFITFTFLSLTKIMF